MLLCKLFVVGVVLLLGMELMDAVRMRVLWEWFKVRGENRKGHVKRTAYPEQCRVTEANSGQAQTAITR